ncbi:hypothetical protein TKK_0003570 [Trichogramma kaykai]|uniref:NOL1/NOP2/Sun domain family member 4 n=1 Tax=Trichogramma kaykai TaxID=54128 RepID=A0ABD2XPZ2_9HYME
MTRLFESHKLFNIFKVPVRYKNPDHHWSVLKKKKRSTQKALEHFDDFYKTVYGEDWKNIRSALLNNKEHKYVAIVNNFSDVERISQELETIGAIDLKAIYKAFEATMKNDELKEDDEIHTKDQITVLQNIIAQKQEEVTKYKKIDPEDEYPTVEKKKLPIDQFQPTQLQSIETSASSGDNKSRVIQSSSGIASSQLFEFVPTKQLIGMDDWVLESDHYNYYKEGSDFTIKVVEETELNFPDALKIYTYEEGNHSKFPKAKTGSTGAADYFCLDGASIFPVLSLDLQPADTMLDMCAAPGGKSMMALQTLYPRIIVANDIQTSRTNRINDFLEEFLPDMGDWREKFFLTQSDARHIDEQNIYNKILVDVPCTTDRHVLHEDENNIFKGTRTKERLRLPQLQSEILVNALKIVVPGGTVVYSTCSLSPVQNDGVVQMSLKRAYEEYNVVFVVKDQTRALLPLKYLYNFGDFGLKYGHIVVPSKSRNSGPMYFCKMVRVQ